MLRRIHTPALRAGETVALDPAAAHHARDVLRLTIGTEVELFDDAGATAVGRISDAGPRGVMVVVDAVTSTTDAGPSLTIASAVPKGERADWMVEKLSELGVARFIPLAAARSVVLPEGKNKRERWQRIATESAKQSRRRGVMRIDPLATLDDAIAAAAGATGRWVLSTTADATPVAELVRAATSGSERASLAMFVGPEGGWTTEELAQFTAAGFTGARLTTTILRIETAAIAAAAAVGVLAASAPTRVS